MRIRVTITLPLLAAALLQGGCPDPGFCIDACGPCLDEGLTVRNLAASGSSIAALRIRRDGAEEMVVAYAVEPGASGPRVPLEPYVEYGLEVEYGPGKRLDLGTLEWEQGFSCAYIDAEVHLPAVTSGAATGLRLDSLPASPGAVTGLRLRNVDSGVEQRFAYALGPGGAGALVELPPGRYALSYTSCAAGPGAAGEGWHGSDPIAVLEIAAGETHVFTARAEHECYFQARSLGRRACDVPRSD